MSARYARFAMLLCSMTGLTAAGCDGGSGTQCAIDDDCASGFCKADGTCGDSDVDGGAGDDSGGSDGDVSATCMPNHDGVIELGELPMAAGKTGTFRIATNATWNTAGTAAANGQRTWDLTGALSGDADRELTLGAPTGEWWSDLFPGATYATELAAGSALRGVFELGGTKLELLGVVSPDGGAYKTELEYDGSATILQLPLQAGSSWTSTSTVSGYANGVGPGAYTEKYESNVDHVGTMKTPYGEFPVVRIVTDLTRTSGFSTLLTKRTFTWVAECFGPVATVSSRDFETSDEFDDPAEVRRLAP